MDNNNPQTKTQNAKLAIVPVIAMFFQMLPKGAAMLVTKEIIANMKNMVMMGIRLLFFFSISVCVCFLCIALD